MVTDLEAEVLNRIIKEDPVSLAQKMVRINSENPPGKEKELADFMADMLKASGLEVLEYDFKPKRPNVVAVYSSGSNARSLIFNGHLDTVPFGDLEKWSANPLSGAIKEGRLYGRGSADMKSSIAAFMAALDAIMKSKVKLAGNIIIALTSDEEESCVGAKDILEKGYRASAAIVGEPSDLQINIAHKGFARFNLITFGKLAHASKPDEGINAIYKMSKAVSRLEEIARSYSGLRSSHPILGGPTLSVGIIKGGVKDNIIPDSCEITIDRRLLPGQFPQDVEDELERELAKIAKDDPQFKYKLELYNSQPASETDPSEEVVETTRKAIKEVVNSEPKVEGMPATTEMSHFVKAGIPTIIMGCGDIKMAHTIDESLPVQQVIDAAKIYALIMLRYIGTK
jgi:acetylornithine deacetylase/succinyl-diaminopimelate desuccinylase family protein